MKTKKSPKIGFVHTGVPIGVLMKQLMSEHLPETPVINLVDDSLIQDLLKAGEMTPPILKRLSAQVTLAEEAGADIIMVTCSSIAPGVDLAKKMVNTPVIKIDEPMAEKAVDSANTIGVLGTAKTTLVPSVKLVKEVAEKKGKSVTVESVLVAEAFDCFLKGDMENHDTLVLEAGINLVNKTDILVLAQASMSHMAPAIEEKTGKQVLTSPVLAVKYLKKMLDNF